MSESGLRRGASTAYTQQHASINPSVFIPQNVVQHDRIFHIELDRSVRLKALITAR